MSRLVLVVLQRRKETQKKQETDGFFAKANRSYNWTLHSKKCLRDAVKAPAAAVVVFVGVGLAAAAEGRSSRRRRRGVRTPDHDRPAGIHCQRHGGFVVVVQQKEEEKQEWRRRRRRRQEENGGGSAGLRHSHGRYGGEATATKGYQRRKFSVVRQPTKKMACRIHKIPTLTQHLSFSTELSHELNTHTTSPAYIQ